MCEGTDSNQSVIDAARARKGATIFISNEVGEGTGALLSIPIIRSACQVISKMARISDLK